MFVRKEKEGPTQEIPDRTIENGRCAYCRDISLWMEGLPEGVSLTHKKLFDSDVTPFSQECVEMDKGHIEVFDGKTGERRPDLDPVLNETIQNCRKAGPLQVAVLQYMLETGMEIVVPESAILKKDEIDRKPKKPIDPNKVYKIISK